jgi:hypothetical protein
MTTPQSKALKVLLNDLIDELLAGYQKPEDLTAVFLIIYNQLGSFY